jgi:tetratricopeptide (TPR) repeat protein
MSKLAIAIVLSALFVVCGQTATTNATAQSQLLTVKDPAEYDAYIKVVQTTAPTERVQVAERFLWQYPHTVVKAEVLKLLLLAYQQLKNEDEAVRTAQRLLDSEPENLRALALLAYTYRECATRNGADAKRCSDNAVRYGHRGLEVIEKDTTAPGGMTVEEFSTLKTQVRPIFEKAISLEQSPNKKPK